jgi:hypothetical protein
MMESDGTMVLTADDLAALRKASGVVFQTTRDGSAIRAILDKGRYSDQVAVYTAREQRLFAETRSYDMGRERTIKCHARCVAYGGDDNRRMRDGFTAFHFDQFAYDTDWQSIAATLRVGDTVTLCWVASNNSENMTNVGYVRDELRIEFGNDSRKRTFLVDVQCGPCNSARMVKPGGFY